MLFQLCWRFQFYPWPCVTKLVSELLELWLMRLILQKMFKSVLWLSSYTTQGTLLPIGRGLYSHLSPWIFSSRDEQSPSTWNLCSCACLKCLDFLKKKLWICKRCLVNFRAKYKHGYWISYPWNWRKLWYYLITLTHFKVGDMICPSL